MAMYYYASKISAIACGARCKRSVLQKSRGQRDRDKCHAPSNAYCTNINGRGSVLDIGLGDGGIYDGVEESDVFALASMAGDGIRLRRRHSDQMDGGGGGGGIVGMPGVGGVGLEMDFQQLEVSTAPSSGKTTFTGYTVGNANGGEVVQYDIPKNTFKRSYTDVNYENSVLGSGGIMYINGRIVSGPLESLIEVLVPKNIIDLDKEFIFSFLLSSRLFLRPHELLEKLLAAVPDAGESLESLVALLAEWTQKFPYDFRDERMMSHVKHIVARCSNTRLEGLVSEILSALLKRLTDLERHEEELRACQTQADKLVASSPGDCLTSSQYAQILCRLEKKLAKQIGPEEFLQCSSNVLLDKQKKWDQPLASGGPPGAQDPKKTCNLETYLDWSARLRLFVCNEILQCSGIRDRSRTVELWSGVAQYCLLVGNYNSATAILETLESPPIARLKITWSKLTTTCQQLDCMQRHAEGHGDLWQKQAIVLNENHHHHQQQHHHHHQNQPKTDALSSSSATTMLSTATNGTTSTTIQPIAGSAASSTIMVSSLSTSSSSAADGTVLTATTTTSTATSTPPSSSPSTTALGATTTLGVGGTTILGAVGATTILGAGGATTTLGSATTTNTPKQPTSTINVEALEVPATTTTTITNLTTTAEATHIKKISPAHGHASNSSISPSLSSSASTYSASHGPQLTAAGHTAATTSPGTTTTTMLVTPTAATTTTTTVTTKPNDWVVIPVFADIVKLALAGRDDCLQRLPNGHINIGAFDRVAAIVGAFTKHMNTVKSTKTTSATTSTSTSTATVTTETPPGEYATFCRRMQQTTKLAESELMMASFDCEEPNNAEKLMYDLN